MKKIWRTVQWSALYEVLQKKKTANEQPRSKSSWKFTVKFQKMIYEEAPSTKKI